MTNAFVASEGFGVGRMLRVWPGAIEREDDTINQQHPIVTMKAADDVYDWKPGSHASFAEKDVVSLPDVKGFEGLHEYSTTDFVNRDGFGYVKDRNHVAGFIPHEFSADMPETFDESQKSLPGKGEGWRATRIELVSLLKFDKPGVCVSEHLPRMDELREAPTRPLDYFEFRSLARLKSGENLAIEKHGNRARMLGALRASKTCLKCHDVEQAEMLGALSYRLTQK